MNGEKRYIPNTNPDWGRELPDGDLNSLVDKAGNNYDNGYNFDEKDDEDERANENGEQAQKFEKDLSSSAILAHEMTDGESDNEDKE